ncbi:SH3 domain-containing protein Dlish [Amphibalanus amphitrite]|uniref:SH3 domain-containing protein Dlish n=1 Tax=Amphibalanus amphitrite TaxID=1232801 RepID=A0A6A4W917_AMPAM|nr:SH3 domain-containing protein Dlish [Amphibalanus amphitrite]
MALGSRPTRRKPESPGAERSPDGPEARAASQATPRTPANIPMVVTCSSELYVLSPAAAPDRPTVTLQLGLVVNGLFKRRQWVYVQTPHSQEGRSPSEAAEPHPNRTDTEKLYENVTSDGRALGLLVQQHVRQQRGQQRARRGHLSPQTRHVSSAFRRLQSVQVAPSRSRLLAPPSGRMVAPRTNNKAVIWDGFTSFGRNTLTVRRGDIVILLNTSVGDWFWVKDADGREGYIPAICVGSGLT